MNRETKHWQSIDTAPADRDILIYVAAWGPLIARLNSEFREWTSHAVPGVARRGGGSPDPLDAAA